MFSVVVLLPQEVAGSGGQMQASVLSMHQRVGLVRLDAGGCISLSDVLHAFTTGVKEEQAWALCHQVIKAGQAVLNNPEDKNHSFLVTETLHVKLHQDGSVHKDTFLLEPEPQGKGEFSYDLYLYTRNIYCSINSTRKVSRAHTYTYIFICICRTIKN